MGLDVFLMRGEEEIELPSTKYPYHYFKIGYWHSDYNEQGINSILHMLGIGDLWTLESRNNWNERLIYAKAMLNELKNAIALVGNIRIMTLSGFHMHANPPQNAKEALGVYLAELARNREINAKARPENQYREYRNKFGNFWLGDEPLPVRAAIEAEIDTDRIFLAVETPDDWYGVYVQALEIVVESCEWVLAQTDPNSYTLVWSG